MSTKLSDYISRREQELDGDRRASLNTFRRRYSLASDLMALRRERGLSQQALAGKSGVAQSEVSRIERGVANPTLATITALAVALDARIQLVGD